MAVVTPTNLDYLIDFLRMRLGDTNPLAYRYTDDWLRTALISGVKTLSKWWNFKYLLDASYNIYRNSASVSAGVFLLPEPPIIESPDEEIIILMGAYILLEGSLENSAWDFVSWADNEIRYSNLESSRARTETLRRMWEELTNTLKPPTKRLAQSLKNSLPGYLNNSYERDIENLG